MDVSAKCIENGYFELQAGTHTLLCDQREQYGGQDRGPMPTELLLCAIASCFGYAMHFVAGRMRKTIDNLVVDVDGEKDFKNCTFSQITVTAGADMDTGTLKKMVLPETLWVTCSN
jgi:uncharacterized OsmC-like protein